MATNNENKLTFGVILLTFGAIFLLDKLDVLSAIPYGNHATSTGFLILIAGIICLFTKAEKKLGWILTAVGLWLNADIFLPSIRNLSPLFFPIIMIAVGLFLLLRSKK